jgi:hypothetical protein
MIVFMWTNGGRVFLAALIVKVVVFAWIANFGFPRTDGDNIFFHQPAYMYYYHGKFTIPTLEGRLPHVQDVFGAYPPGYTFAALAVFKLFGFSMPSILWMDIIIHLMLSTLLSLAMFFVLRSGTAAGLFLLASSFLISPRGRPDELAALFVCLAIIVFLKRKSVFGASIILGFAFVTQPVIGLVGFLVLTWLDYQCNKRGVRKTIWLIFSIIVLSVTVASAIWLLAIYPNVPQSLEQFIAHLKFRHAPKPMRMLTQIPTWGTAFVCLTMVSTFGAVPFYLKRHGLESVSFAQHVAIKLLVFCLPVIAVVQLALSSPHYSYRLLSYLFLGGSFMVIWLWWQRSRLSRMLIKTPLLVTVAILCAVMVLANNEIIRYSLLPFAWNERNVRWQQALEYVSQHVSPKGMVGGDPILWWMLADGRPYYSLGWYKGKEVPDYILSGTFWAAGGETDVLMRPGWPSLLRQLYEEITPATQAIAPAQLSIGPVVIPISRSSAADWRVRIWKKKSHKE